VQSREPDKGNARGYGTVKSCSKRRLTRERNCAGIRIRRGPLKATLVGERTWKHSDMQKYLCAAGAHGAGEKPNDHTSTKGEGITSRQGGESGSPNENAQEYCGEKREMGTEERQKEARNRTWTKKIENQDR